MSFAKVTYPPPPPTCNTLTSQERSQLLRSTKKLGKILGSTPHFIDGSHTLEIDDSPVSDHSSTRSASFSSESATSYDSAETNSSLTSSGSMTSYTETVNSADTWRVRKPIRKPPPLLRLSSSTVTQGPPAAIASVKPSLDTIPASPHPEVVANKSSTESSRHSLAISFADNRASSAPSFSIPSEAALRSAKMERLKRRLGDEVPADLVFPADVSEVFASDTVVGANPASAPNAGRTSNKALPNVPNPVPRSSFSLERPLFGIVEGPDDHVSGCFEFASRRERAALSRGQGRRRT